MTSQSASFGKPVPLHARSRRTEGTRSSLDAATRRTTTDRVRFARQTGDGVRRRGRGAGDEAVDPEAEADNARLDEEADRVAGERLPLQEIDSLVGGNADPRRFIDWSSPRMMDRNPVVAKAPLQPFRGRPALGAPLTRSLGIGGANVTDLLLALFSGGGDVLSLLASPWLPDADASLALLPAFSEASEVPLRRPLWSVGGASAWAAVGGGGTVLPLQEAAEDAVAEDLDPTVRTSIGMWSAWKSLDEPASSHQAQRLGGDRVSPREAEREAVYWLAVAIFQELLAEREGARRGLRFRSASRKADAPERAPQDVVGVAIRGRPRDVAEGPVLRDGVFHSRMASVTNSDLWYLAMHAAREKARAGLYGMRVEAAALRSTASPARVSIPPWFSPSSKEQLRDYSTTLGRGWEAIGLGPRVESLVSNDASRLVLINPGVGGVRVASAMNRAARDGSSTQSSRLVALRDASSVEMVNAPVCPPGEISVRLEARPSVIEVGVGSVTLSDHPLFCEEDRVAASLKVDVEEVLAHSASGVIPSLDARIAALLPEVDALHTSYPGDESPSSEHSGHDLSVGVTPLEPAAAPRLGWSWRRDDEMQLLARCADVIAHLNERRDEWHSYTDSMVKLYRRWQRIKALRLSSKMTRNPVTLRLVPVTPREPTARRTRARDDDDEDDASAEQEDAPPTLGPSSAPRVGTLRVISALLHDLSRKLPGDHRARSILQIGIPLVARLGAVAQQRAPPDECGGLEGDGKEYLPDLHRNDSILTPLSTCTALEQQRRKRLSGCRIRAQILVNGQVLLVSKPEALSWPDYKVEVNASITARVFRRPQRIEVVLWEVGTLFDTLVAGIIAPVPGLLAPPFLPATSVAPIDAPFRFASTLPMDHEATFVSQEEAHVTGRPPAVGALLDRRITGSVGVAVSWRAGALPAPALALVEADDGTQRVEGLVLEPSGAGVRVGGITAGAAAGASVISGAQASTTAAASQLSALRDTTGMGALRAALAVDPGVAQKSLDPNDPRNASAVVAGKSWGILAGITAESFRTAVLSDKLAFSALPPAVLTQLADAFRHAHGGALRGVSTQSIVKGLKRQLQGRSAKRHRLLRLRGKADHMFPKRPLPMTDDEVAQDPVLSRLAMYDEAALEAEEARKRYRESRGGDNAISFGEGQGLSAGTAASVQASVLSRVKDFMARLEASRSGRLPSTAGSASHIRRRLRTSEVVRDAALPTVIGLIDLSWIAAFFAPRRPLRPIPQSQTLHGALAGATTQVMGGPEMGVTHMICVQVIRARNVAVRSSYMQNGRAIVRGALEDSRFVSDGVKDSTKAAGEGGTAEEEVLPAFSVRFRGSISHGSTRPGASSTWNEVLRVPLDAGGEGLSPMQLAGIRDSIEVFVHDHVRVSKTARGGASLRRHETRVDRRYLGRVSIPFSSLYSQGLVEGEFQLASPPLVMGYQSLRQKDSLREAGVTATGAATMAGMRGEDAGDGLTRRRAGGGADMGSLAAMRREEEEVESVTGFAGTMLTAADAAGDATFVTLSITVDPPLPRPDEGDENSILDRAYGSGRVRRIRTRVIGGVSSAKTLRTKLGDMASSTPEAVSLRSALTDSETKRRARLYKANAWCESLKSRFKDRDFSCVVMDLDGEPRLVSEYITPQPPPPTPGSEVRYIREGDKLVEVPVSYWSFNSTKVRRLGSPEACVRYVSLIPFISDWDAFGRNADVWTTSAECLEMGAGDWEEHAVLLCNQLRYLEGIANGGIDAGKARHALLMAEDAAERRKPEGEDADPSEEGEGAEVSGGSAVAERLVGWKSYVVHGMGIPEGNASYVLRRRADGSRALVINAATGRSYDVRDPDMPMQRVYLIIGEDNIWANIQPQMKPSDMSWNVEDSSLFERFVKPGEQPLQEVVTPSQGPLLYRPPAKLLAARLQAEIEDTLRTRLRLWRRRFSTRTSFRSELTDRLRALLGGLEQRAAAVGSSLGVSESWDAGGKGRGIDLAAAHIHRLARAVTGHEVVGCPINMPFKDLQHVVQAVRHTAVHEVEDPRATFAVACMVTPYPGLVFSVWVYVLALIPE
jgi:hypothetical protein